MRVSLAVLLFLIPVFAFAQAAPPAPVPPGAPPSVAIDPSTPITTLTVGKFNAIMRAEVLAAQAQEAQLNAQPYFDEMNAQVRSASGAPGPVSQNPDAAAAIAAQKAALEEQRQKLIVQHTVPVVPAPAALPAPPEQAPSSAATNP